MSERTELCKFAVKETESETTVEVVNGQTVRKIKKVIQKYDDAGNPLYEVKEVKVKKGCGCKGKNREEKIVKKKVPVTEDVWVEETIDNIEKKLVKNGEQMIICKLYGKVKKSFCQSCSTYKTRRR